MILAHVPVMLAEAMDALSPADDRVYADATLGAGGYTRSILERADARVCAFDRDPSAIEAARIWGKAYGQRLALINRPFAEIEEGLTEAGETLIDGAVFDLGVSSMQLDQAERGFSYRQDGPLSMRMDMARPDASDVVNHSDAKDLAAIFRVYGEERHAGRIARAIVAERAKGEFLSTARLAAVVAKAAPNRGADKIHPATRVFQALRIFVNDELGQLARALVAAEKVLRPAGRLVIVTFHSLEDRIVKRFMADRSGDVAGPSRHAPAASLPEPTFQMLFDKARTPLDGEVAENPRARSAKLRAAVRLSSAARTDADSFAPPRPALSRALHHWR